MASMDTENRRLKVIRLAKKLAHTDTDIQFLLACKKNQHIPKGLQIKNPLKNTYETEYSQRLCRKTSQNLLTHLTHVLYKKRATLQNKTDIIATTQELTVLAHSTRKYHYHILWISKQKKFDRLKTSETTAPEVPPASATGTDHPGHKAIINLSDHTLSSSETEVLTYGLNYCPTTKLDPIALAADTEEFIRRIRLKEFFHHCNKTATEQREPVQSKKKESNFTPPEGRCPRLDTYAEVLRKSVIANYINKSRRIHHNLTPLQRQATRSLKQNREIVIKPADKGGAVVIQNRTDYIAEAHRQLNNQRDYKQLPSDPTRDHCRQLQQLIKTLDDSTQQATTSLIPKDPRPGTLYLLPKVHKANIPGRPIISGNGTLCEGISGYVEGILKPLVQDTPSFCRDTTDFLQRIHHHGDVTPGTLLVTMDVSALYTSIPHDDGIAATHTALQSANYTSPDDIARLIRFILDHNYFTFYGHHYIQTHGTAMGTRFAPQYANLFMHRLEQDFLSTQHLQPLLYTRYIDDIFFIWTHGEDQLKSFYDAFNAFHPTIRLTMDYSAESV